MLPGMDYQQMNALAAEAPVGSDGLTFAPYLTGERTPHNDPNAKAAWAGLDLRHDRRHLIRSVFEGVTFGLKDGFQALQELGASGSQIRVTGGGAKSPFWLQLVADVFGYTCVTLEVDEGPAMGAAILAGVGIGLWPNVETACRETIRVRDKIEPSTEKHAGNYKQAYARYRHLYPSLREWNLF
jgi:xylulokinase